MSQFIARLQDVPDVAGLTLVLRGVYMRDAVNSAWTVVAADAAATANALALRDSTGKLAGVANLASANAFAIGTITTSQPQTIAQTWNAAGVTFSPLTITITDTASAAGSLLLDLQTVAGGSRFNVGKLGDVLQNGAGSTTSAPRSIGITPFNPGEAGRFSFGIDAGFQGGYGVNFQVYGYHGVDFYTGQQSLSPPAFLSGTNGAYCIKARGAIVVSDASGSTEILLGRSTTNTMYLRGDSGASVAPTLELQGQSSTTAGRKIGAIAAAWATATDATRKGRVTFVASDAAGDREVYRIESDGANALHSWFGVAAVGRAAAITQTYSTASRTHANPTGVVMTNNSGGAISTTIAAITAGTTYAQADLTAIKNAIASLADQHAKVVADLANAKQLINALTDDLQAYGLEQ